jgi:mono/diheme cytochrome c family protein
MKKNLILIVWALLATSCYYDNEEALYPELDDTCDSANPTYAISVKGILDTYCMSCHNSGNAAGLGGSVNLEGYAQVKIFADNGRLLGAISHDSGYAQMPKGSSKLSDCQIETIANWISAGANNN